MAEMNRYFIRGWIFKAIATLMLILLIVGCSEKKSGEIDLGEILYMSDGVPNGLVLGRRWDMASDKNIYTQAKMQELDDTTGNHVASVTLYLFDTVENSELRFDELSSRFLENGEGSEITLPADIGEQVVGVDTDQATMITFVRCRVVAQIGFDKAYEGNYGLNEFSLYAQELDQRIASYVCP
jgi:hypothetical protein